MTRKHLITYFAFQIPLLKHIMCDILQNINGLTCAGFRRHFLKLFYSSSTVLVRVCRLLHHAQPAVLANKSQLHRGDEWQRRSWLHLPGRGSHHCRGWHQQINSESHQCHGGGKFRHYRRRILTLQLEPPLITIWTIIWIHFLLVLRTLLDWDLTKARNSYFRYLVSGLKCSFCKEFCVGFPASSHHTKTSRSEFVTQKRTLVWTWMVVWLNWRRCMNGFYHSVRLNAMNDCRTRVLLCSQPFRLISSHLRQV